MPQHPQRLAAAATLSAIVGLSSSACTGPERSTPPIVIGIDPHSSEQQVLGEVYLQLLESVGAEASVEPLELGKHESNIDALRSGRVDFVVACSGSVLEFLDPQRAQEMARELDAADISAAEEAQLSDTVYGEAVGSLPGNLMTVDPSPAQGCVDRQEEQLSLPQNIIPLFHKFELSKGETYRVNFIGRALDTSDLSEMVDEVESGKPVTEVVSPWMLDNANISVTNDVDDTDTDGNDDSNKSHSDELLDQPPV